MHLASTRAAPFGFSDQSKIPAEWLIQCLSTLNPDHQFFQSDYYPDDYKGPRIIFEGDNGSYSRYVMPPGRGSNTIVACDEHMKHQMEVLDNKINYMNESISQQFEKLFLFSQQQSMQQSYRQSQANTPVK